MGNILGKSTANVSIIDDRASATTTSNVGANEMSQSSGGRNPDRQGELTDRKSPPAIDANGPPISRKITDRKLPPAICAEGYPISQIEDGELPPAIQANGQPPNVSNPFMMNGNESSSTAKRYWPGNLIQLAREMVNSSSIEPANPEFSFLLDQESAHKKLCVLKKYDFNLETALDAQKDSPLSYGSEFKSTEILDSIFSRHPNWNRMKLILKKCSSWPMENLPLQEKLNDLQEALAFGNHKGAASKPKVLRDLVEKDVTFGYGLVLPLDKLERVSGV